MGCLRVFDGLHPSVAYYAPLGLGWLSEGCEWASPIVDV